MDRYQINISTDDNHRLRPVYTTSTLTAAYRSIKNQPGVRSWTIWDRVRRETTDRGTHRQDPGDNQ